MRDQMAASLAWAPGMRPPQPCQQPSSGDDPVNALHTADILCFFPPLPCFIRVLACQHMTY